MKLSELLDELNNLVEKDPSVLEKNCVVQVNPLRAKHRKPFYVKVFYKGHYPESEEREVCIIPVSQSEEKLCPFCGTKIRSYRRSVCKNCKDGTVICA